ncbi:hypothetical protein EUGRSUZ_F00887 [Eucalyptus grandis]|uniref:Uncharacterized protein n=2 Tax=Eucalyptus grandis TaxID=71139 RepID=A0ACC3KCS1_EUCGR|nr:hypothetical protein EUGRSUZ_F00887 [Eucalyptus grandis]
MMKKKMMTQSTQRFLFYGLVHFYLPHVRKEALLTLTKFDPSLGRQRSSKNNTRRTFHQRYCTPSATPLRNFLETSRKGKNSHLVSANIYT